MFKKFILIILALFLLFAAGGMLLPTTAHVERSIVIDRPASTIFSLLNSYRMFSTWSPWARRDPDMEYSFSGPERGQGARMEWKGNPRLVGSGWQEITVSRPWSLIEMQMDFEQQGEAVSRFEIKPENSGSLVTWTFDSDLVAADNFLNGLLNRYFGLLFDQWIGADYEEGLVSLKSLAESIADVDFSDLEVIELDVAPTAILYVPTLVDESTFNIADSLAKAYGEITAFMLEHGIEIEAKPLAITRSGRNAGFEIDAAIPLPGTPPELTGNIRYGQTPSGRALQVVHRGTHDRLMMTHQKLEAYMKAHGITQGTVSWEEYVSNPAVTPEDKLLTHIFILLGNDAYSP